MSFFSFLEKVVVSVPAGIATAVIALPVLPSAAAIAAAGLIVGAVADSLDD